MRLLVWLHEQLGRWAAADARVMAERFPPFETKTDETRSTT